MQSQDSRPDLLLPEGGGSHFRARSPSPFQSPAHQHLTMDGLRISQNNNHQAHTRPGLSLPARCSAELGKVLEKQMLEVRVNCESKVCSDKLED